MQNNRLEIKYLTADKITPYKNNSRTHSKAQIDQLKKSIQEFGMCSPIALHNGTIVYGHARFQSLQELGHTEFPTVDLSHLNEEQKKAYIIADNKLALNAGWDEDILKQEIIELDNDNFDLKLLGFDMEELADLMLDELPEQKEESLKGNLNLRFGVPPFSILDTRQGYWQDQKKKWKEIINDNGESREGTLSSEDSLMGEINNGVSLLDPVLAEIMTKWYTPHAGSKCFDCFAGDTVFGFVNSKLGNHFTGIELRKEQADLNNARLAEFENSQYFNDDGQNVLKHIPEKSQDMLFSCPPYYDLEVYSDLPNDASNQGTYEDFLQILDNAFTDAIKCLKDDSFATIVVGDIRDKDGFYYRFHDDIKNIFCREGCKLYNEMVLIDMIGTAHMRANQNMKSRKVVKTHQNVLVFYKGNPKNIPAKFPKLEIEGLDENPDNQES